MRHQHGIVAPGRERPERAIGDGDLAHHDAALQAEVARDEGFRVG